MVRLHRHQLVRLAPSAWERLQRQAADTVERDCLRHWATHGLPLVITQQRCDWCAAQAGGTGDSVAIDDGELALGLAAPLRWARRRIALRATRRDIHFYDEFPVATRLASRLTSRQRSAWNELNAALRDAGATARVYGSHGWQAITDLPYVRAGSDIDLWTFVADPDQADAVARALADADGPDLRLDGELLFQGDLAVSWREWRRLRAGDARSLLVKSLTGARLVHDIDALLSPAALEATS